MRYLKVNKELEAVEYIKKLECTAQTVDVPYNKPYVIFGIELYNRLKHIRINAYNPNCDLYFTDYKNNKIYRLNNEGGIELI